MTSAPPTNHAEEMEAIKQLKARYFRFLDTKDWEGFGSVFVEEPALGPIENGFPDYLLALRPPEARAHITEGSTGLDAFVERNRQFIGPLSSRPTTATSLRSN